MHYLNDEIPITYAGSQNSEENPNYSTPTCSRDENEVSAGASQQAQASNIPTMQTQCLQNPKFPDQCNIPHPKSQTENYMSARQNQLSYISSLPDFTSLYQQEEQCSGDRYVSPIERKRHYSHDEMAAANSESLNNNFSNLGVPAQQGQTRANNAYNDSSLNNATQRTLEEAVNNAIEVTNPSAEAMYTDTIRGQTNPKPTTNNMASYSQVTCLRNPTATVTNKIHKLRIVSPLRKEHFTNASTMQQEIDKAYQEILVAFSPNIRHLITISRTIVKVSEKNYQVLQVIAPKEAENDFNNMKLSGLTIMGRTVFPSSEDFWQVRQSFYPKPATIRSNNVPVICTDEELFKTLEIPAFLEYGAIVRETKHTGIGPVHTGKVAIKIKINSAEEETELRKWSFNKAFANPAEWMGIDIPTSIPMLHTCKKCKEEKRPQFRGHEEEWCRIRRSTPHEPQNENQPSLNRNPELPTAPSELTEQTSASTTVNEETMENENHNHQEDTVIHNQDEEWQTVGKQQGQKRPQKVPSETSSSSRNSSPTKAPKPKQPALQNNSCPNVPDDQQKRYDGS